MFFINHALKFKFQPSQIEVGKLFINSFVCPCNSSITALAYVTAESIVGHIFNFQVIFMISFAALFIYVAEHLTHIPIAPQQSVTE
jgi:hypothetical protein